MFTIADPKIKALGYISIVLTIALELRIKRI
jgi:hypothetical protein